MPIFGQNWKEKQETAEQIFFIPELYFLDIRYQVEIFKAKDYRKKVITCDHVVRLSETR